MGGLACQMVGFLGLFGWILVDVSAKAAPFRWEHPRVWWGTCMLCVGLLILGSATLPPG